MKNSDKKRYTIAVLSGDTQSDFSENTLRYLYKCAEKEYVNIIYLKGPTIPQYCKDILDSNYKGDYHHQFKSVFDYVHFAQADAMIIFLGSVVSYLALENIPEFLEQYATIPYVIVQSASSDEDVPYVVSDNHYGMTQCIEHLITDHGYRKIALLNGPKVNIDAQERQAAYLGVMHAHGIPVTDSMIAYGNYTENVEEHVIALLEQNPGLEAIACANDNMAKACYTVCTRRGLIIGKDIAITGFDDVRIASEMTPPLTSVVQNSCALSYEALKRAISLCKGEPASSCKIPLTLQIRCSCGCEQSFTHSNVLPPSDNLESGILSESERIADLLLSRIPYQEEREQYTRLIKEYFHYIYRAIIVSTEPYHVAHLNYILKELLLYPEISNHKLMDYMLKLLRLIINSVDDISLRKKIALILEDVRQDIYIYEYKEIGSEIKSLNRKSWFVPSLTRDLHHKGQRDNLQDVFKPIMERFQTMNVKSCYIYMFQEPVIHKSNTTVLFPRNIYLAAYYTKDAMLCFPKNKQPRITERKGFSTLLPEGHATILTSFVLFSEDRQYGLMLCEVEPDDISYMYTCGMQIGSLLRYLEMNWTEQDAAKELQNSLNIIQEQNRILSFVSDYDELSQLLNRRGFMEQALACLSRNEGQKAYIVFCDVDHLKEINDCFGHAAGDCAIQSVSQILRDSLPKDSITARIGGDEFVSMILSDKPYFKEELLEHIKNALNSFNENSDLPYYIEFSVGIYEFYCSPDIELTKVIQKSDEVLYQAKKNRRSTIKKA